MTCSTHPDRPEFGCNGCIRSRWEAERKAEWETAPMRSVTFKWSIETSGEFTADVKVPASWLDDDDLLSNQLGAVFDELCSGDAYTKALLALQLDASIVGKVVPQATVNDNQPSLLDGAS